jgi:protein involved in polysaccharide export with SLBB domain
MKKSLLTLFTILLGFQAFAQMPDQQVIQFIRQSTEQGLSQSEISAELMSRGVTVQQLQRLGAVGSIEGLANSSSEERWVENNRLRTDPVAQQLPLVQVAEPQPQNEGTPIFGHNVFSGKNLTFEPSLNVATPDNYLLGPGDQIIIDIWGDSDQTIRQTISPDGTIVLSRLGPVVLSGFTVAEAGARLKHSLAGVYGAASVKLSLGQIRSIQVHVMGEVENPGTYTLPSLATLFHVLYKAGGVNEIGSLREISVNRAGKRIATVDVYSYLLEGRSDVDVALKDGDIVVVSPYINLVEVTGRVKRPMKYEMKGAQTLASLLDYSGGFSGDAYQEVVTVVRRSGRMREVYDVQRADFDNFALTDADSIAVGGAIDRFSNRLEVTGAVFRPGLYSASEGIATITELIGRAEGLTGDAFTARALLTREKPDYTLEVVPVDVAAILAGTSADIPLRNGDVLHIPSIFDLREEYRLTVQGAVRNPGQYPFADNLSIEDVIVSAGGLLESASSVKVDIFRRIKQSASTSESEARSESFSFPIRDGLAVGGGETFRLEPFDVVTFRTSPGYEVQKSVSVEGEVLFPGDYSLVKHGERLSDLVKRAGGALSTAYIKGAKLVRRRSIDEQTRTEATVHLTELGGLDSLSTRNLNVAETYRVGIELDRAIADPGSDYDLVLAEGDVLFIPEHVGTVSISGAVLFPNTVSFREGMTVKQYIEQAGGYAHRARKGAKYVVYMNGTISRVRSLQRAELTPGCEIVVPFKPLRTQSRTSLAEIMSIATSATSSASLIATLANTLK